MDGSLHAPPILRSFSALFAEDFDAREMPPDPEVIEPSFSASELAGARDAAWREGHLAGLHETAASEAVATRQALEAIASQIKDGHDAAIALAEQTSEAIARLLLASLAAMFPALCARYGDAEVGAIIRSVLPQLTQESIITVRANPGTAAGLTQEISRLDPDLAARVQTIPCDAMPPGDVRVTWHNGNAIRDAAALWQQVAAVLVPAGLLPADAMTRETLDGC